MFFFTRLSQSAYVYDTLPKGIGRKQIDIKKGTTLFFYPPMSSRYLVAIASYSNDLCDILVGTQSEKPKAIDSTYSYIFPPDSGNLTIIPKKEGTLVVNYAELPGAACQSGVDVTTKVQHESSFQITKEDIQLDKCFFYATPAETCTINIEESAQLNQSRLLLYHEVINDRPYDVFYGEEKTYSYVKAPFLFRLDTDSKPDAVEIKFSMSSEATLPSTNWVGTPVSLAAQKNAESEMYWYLPVIGSVLPICLIVAWIYTFVKLYRQAPIATTNFWSDEVVSPAV